MATSEDEQRVFTTTLGLFERFGPERLRDTPIAERGFVGMCCGAAMTGTAHFTVSRLLSNWKDRGIVTTARSRITVHDLAALEALAAGQA